MAEIPIGEVHCLMVDYVRQRDLRLRCLETTAWEEFRTITGITKSANWLKEEYCSKFFQDEFKCPDLNVQGVNGELSPNLYDWCNDAREGLRKKGVDVQRRLPPVHPNFFDSISQQMNSDSSSRLQRPKKKITPMERLTRIKKTLVKQKRRLSIGSNSSG